MLNSATSSRKFTNYQSPKNYDHLVKLPNEIQSKIYLNLNNKDRASLRLTCEYWSIIGGQIQKFLSIKTETLDNLSYFPNVEEIRILQHTDITLSPNHCEILKKCRNLRSVYLHAPVIHPLMFELINQLPGLIISNPKMFQNIGKHQGDSNCLDLNRLKPLPNRYFNELNNLTGLILDEFSKFLYEENCMEKLVALTKVTFLRLYNAKSLKFCAHNNFDFLISLAITSEKLDKEDCDFIGQLKSIQFIYIKSLNIQIDHDLEYFFSKKIYKLVIIEFDGKYSQLDSHFKCLNCTPENYTKVSKKYMIAIFVDLLRLGFKHNSCSLSDSEIENFLLYVCNDKGLYSLVDQFKCLENT